jgi:hypothetical protein
VGESLYDGSRGRRAAIALRAGDAPAKQLEPAGLDLASGPTPYVTPIELPAAAVCGKRGEGAAEAIMAVGHGGGVTTGLGFVDTEPGYRVRQRVATRIRVRLRFARVRHMEQETLHRSRAPKFSHDGAMPAFFEREHTAHLRTTRATYYMRVNPKIRGPAIQ